MRKAGPNGVFTIIMGLTWICDLAETPAHHYALEWISGDVAFVLEKVSSLASSKSNAIGLKRKAADKQTGAPSKKRKQGN